MGIVQEFKTFAVKGNVVDMAVGIVIGAAFTKVVNSLVNDVIMPPIGLAVGGVEFKNLRIVLKEAALGPAGEEIPEVAIRYGMFTNTLIDFLIVAICMFLVVRFMNRAIAMRERRQEGAG